MGVVGFLNECFTRWVKNSRSRVHVVVEGDPSACVSVQDEATLEQAVVRLAAASVLGGSPAPTLRIQVAKAGPPEVRPQTEWVGITFSVNGRSASLPSRRPRKDVRDAYWNELTRVSRLARAVGGRLVAPEPEGQGRPVILYLPYDRAEASAQEPEPATRGEGQRSHKILLLEDNAETRWAIAEILARKDYEVAEAGTPEEVLRLADKPGGKIHLIIGDLVLGVRDGVMLLLDVSALLGGVPILLVTGRRLEEDTRSWLEATGVQWLRKPFGGDELLQRVHDMLAGSLSSEPES